MAWTSVTRERPGVSWRHSSWLELASSRTMKWFMLCWRSAVPPFGVVFQKLDVEPIQATRAKHRSTIELTFARMPNNLCGYPHFMRA